jgi:hypothetical protein
MMRRLIHSLLCVLALAFSVNALAQNAKSPLELLPAVPPPPPEMAPLDAALEPQVTIKKRVGETVEEFRLNGKLYMLKITPDNAPPYYLVDDRGDGGFVRRDSIDSGVRVPRWVIKTF